MAHYCVAPNGKHRNSQTANRGVDSCCMICVDAAGLFRVRYALRCILYIWDRLVSCQEKGVVFKTRFHRIQNFASHLIFSFLDHQKIKYISTVMSGEKVELEERDEEAETMELLDDEGPMGEPGGHNV